MEWRCHRSGHWRGLGNLQTRLTHRGLSEECNSFYFFHYCSQNDCLNPSTLSQLWTPSVYPLVLLVTAAALDSNCRCKLGGFFPSSLTISPQTDLLWLWRFLDSPMPLVSLAEWYLSPHRLLLCETGWIMLWASCRVVSCSGGATCYLCSSYPSDSLSGKRSFPLFSFPFIVVD